MVELLEGGGELMMSVRLIPACELSSDADGGNQEEPFMSPG